MVTQPMAKSHGAFALDCLVIIYNDDADILCGLEERHGIANSARGGATGIPCDADAKYFIGGRHLDVGHDQGGAAIGKDQIDDHSFLLVTAGRGKNGEIVGAGGNDPVVDQVLGATPNSLNGNWFCQFVGLLLEPLRHHTRGCLAVGFGAF